MDQVHLDKLSRILLIAFALVTIMSIAATHYNTIVLHNFEIIDDLDEVLEEEEE